MTINTIFNAKNLKRLYIVFAAVFIVLLFQISGPETVAQDAKSKKIKPTSKDHPLKELLSGDHFSRPDVKAMQADNAQNPAMLWNKKGAELWKKVEGKEKKACMSCHNKAEVSMKGIGFRYPLYSEAKKTLITLEDRINLCRQKFMKAPTFGSETDNMLALSIYVRNQSYGLPVKIKTDGPAKPYFSFGKDLFYKKRGQMNMSCASCHEKNVGKNLRATRLSQGQINGYPAYSLSWQKTGSALRRINMCNDLTRSKHFQYGSKEHLSLELYLLWRGQGLPVKTPAVRK